MNQRTPTFSKNASQCEVLAHASNLIKNGTSICIATVVSVEGSCPSTPGQKLLVDYNGVASGTIGGGAIELRASERMREMLEKGASTPELCWYSLANDLGMTCGGKVQVLFEPMAAAQIALIVGAGHIGSALATLLVRVGFSVIITDERTEAADPKRFSTIESLSVRCGPPQNVASDTPTNACVIAATHDHELDISAIAWAVKRGNEYIGGVGSKAKFARLRKLLSEDDSLTDAIERVRMPIGVNIGGSSPEEIALSIAAELVAWRRIGYDHITSLGITRK